MKRAVGYHAAECIEDGMIVGLGTGSTAHYFIERLSERCREGLIIKAVASSNRSTEEAHDIPMIDIGEIDTIDITVDGADEIDAQKRMIKGGGGALLREKIVASASREMIVIIDESKYVDHLGGVPLPVEILPFGQKATLRHIHELGYHGKLRDFTTDNGNHIYDITTNVPKKAHTDLIVIPGVVETGFFSGLAGRVFIGHADGSVTHL